MNKKEYTVEDLDAIGHRIAELLNIAKNKEGRYKTGYGNKTGIGLLGMIKMLVEKIDDGEEI